MSSLPLERVVQVSGGVRKPYAEVQFPLEDGTSLVAVVADGAYEYCLHDEDHKLFRGSKDVSDKPGGWAHVRWFLVPTENLARLPLEKLFPTL